LFLGFLLALGSDSAHLEAQEKTFPADDFIVRNVRVFDGITTITKADVVVRHGLIDAIGIKVSNKQKLPEVSGEGRTLLPGLIDAHVHAYEEAHLRAAVVFGVTTELDMFSSPDFIRRMKADQAAGHGLDRADVKSAGIWVSAPGGYGTLLGLITPTLSGPEYARGFVEDRIEEGSDYIKVVYDDGAEYGISIHSLSRETLTLVARVAHEHGKIVVAHVGSQRGAREAVEAGVDGLMHAFMDDPPDPALVALLKEKGCFVVPTLSINASIHGDAAGKALLNDSELHSYLGPSAKRNLALAFPKSNARLRYENAQEFVRKLGQARVTMLGGTDAANPGTWHGVSLLGEVVRLVEAGLTAPEALVSVTSAPAKMFHLTDRGEIRQGLRADLLLVEGDPTAHVEELRKTVAVWKQGVPVNRSAYRKTVEEANTRIENSNRLANAFSESVGRAVISDFEDGTPSVRFGARWMAISDAIVGGKSKGTIQIVNEGAEGSAHALEVSGEIDSSFAYAWAGAAFFPGGTPFRPADISAHKKLSFWTKGSANAFSVLIFTTDRGVFPASMEVSTNSEWQRKSLRLSDFGVDGKGVLAIIFAGGPYPGNFTFRIDDISLD